VGSVTLLPLINPGKEPVPIVQEEVWASEPAWTGAENLASTGIRSLDRPGRRQALYRLIYCILLRNTKLYMYIYIYVYICVF
jgi:hypothetical protein